MKIWQQTHIIELGKRLEILPVKLGGTMPEDLPTPKKSIKELEKERQNRLEA